MTFWNFRARALIGSMISSPPATARLPPGRKSYCMSTTTNASSAPRRIGIVRFRLLSGRRRWGGSSFARGRRGRRAGQQRIAFVERVFGVGAVAGDHRRDLGHEVSLGLGEGLFGEAGIEVFLAGVVDQLVAAVDDALRLGELLGRSARRGIGNGDDQRFTAPELFADVLGDRLGKRARGEKRWRERKRENEPVHGSGFLFGGGS